MPSYYPYLLSSLPALSFGMKPPMSIEKLIASCRGIIPDQDIDTLKEAVSGYLPPAGQCPPEGKGALARWRAFDTMLRNELVKIRASRRKKDPAKYLRKDGCPESAYAAHIAINAYRKPSILESERALDIDRWNELDELVLGHYFDLDALIVYAFKLIILIRWEEIGSADKRGLLEEKLAGPAVS